MTAPNLGICQCQVTFYDGKQQIHDEDHEHSDFEPYACADCDCEGFRPAGTTPGPAENRPHSHGGEFSGVPEGDRPHLVIPDALDFTTERIQQATQWLDQFTASFHVRNNAPIADNPDAICSLADVIENTWPAEIDPYDVIAIAVARAKDTTNRNPAERALAAIRRKIQR